MQIFNKLLGKDDFKAFLDLTREEKVVWIKKYTNQNYNLTEWTEKRKQDLALALV